MNARVARLLIPLVALFALLAFAGCGDDDDSGGTEASESGEEISVGGEDLKGDPVKLGLLTGLTGDYSAFKDAVVGGSEIAIRDVNEGGGILGGPAELIIQDNKSTPEGAVSGFEKLVNVDKVAAIGGVESDGGVAVLERAAEAQVPVICSFCGTTVLDEEGGNFIYRTTASDNDGAAASAQFARDRGFERVALLRQEGEAGRPAEIFAGVWGEQRGWRSRERRADRPGQVLVPGRAPAGIQ